MTVGQVPSNEHLTVVVAGEAWVLTKRSSQLKVTAADGLILPAAGVATTPVGSGGRLRLQSGMNAQQGNRSVGVTYTVRCTLHLAHDMPIMLGACEFMLC